jgi:hypothetical protein
MGMTPARSARPGATLQAGLAVSGGSEPTGQQQDDDDDE